MIDRRNAVALADWVCKHTAVGAKCGNCGMPFTVTEMAKGVVGVPNGAGYSIYALCRLCARRFKRQGTAGIPNAMNDARLATLLWFTPARGTA